MLKLLSLFSGIGAFEKALENLGVQYELTAFCEIDKYATKSYCAIHNVAESKNLGDITKVDEMTLPNDVDLVTYGFPCQDISLAGKQKGLLNADGTKTRSGLFFDALRIIEATKPKIAIAENVKNLTSKKFNAQFQIVLASLESAGYNNYWKILNAKDFDIPQNRERVFIVSIRKDIDNGLFEFPTAIPLERHLKDILEGVVPEEYFLKRELTRKLVIDTDVMEPQVLRLVRNEHGKQIRKQYENGEITEPWTTMKQYEPRTDGVSNTISTVLKDNYLLIRQATKCGYVKAYAGDSVNFEQPSSKTRRGRVGKQVAQALMTSPLQGVVVNGVWLSEKGVKYVLSPKRGMCTDINPDIAQPLTAKGQSNWTGSFISPDIETLQKSSSIGAKGAVKIILKNGETITSTDDTSQLRIRKFTPKECFRLMGFDDESFNRAAKVNSNTQLYKQAGNSIVVDVLEELFCMMLDENGNIYV